MLGVAAHFTTFNRKSTKPSIVNHTLILTRCAYFFCEMNTLCVRFSWIFVVLCVCFFCCCVIVTRQLKMWEIPLQRRPQQQRPLQLPHLQRHHPIGERCYWLQPTVDALGCANDEETMRSWCLRLCWSRLIDGVVVVVVVDHGGWDGGDVGVAECVVETTEADCGWCCCYCRLLSDCWLGVVGLMCCCCGCGSGRSVQALAQWVTDAFSGRDGSCWGRQYLGDADYGAIGLVLRGCDYCYYCCCCSVKSGVGNSFCFSFDGSGTIFSPIWARHNFCCSNEKCKFNNQ